MSAYELQDHEIALSLALVVSGLTVRYVSHDGWPAASGLTDYKAIIGATPMGGTLGILGGSADYQNVTVSLATLGASADSDLDPGINSAGSTTATAAPMPGSSRRWWRRRGPWRST